MASLLSRYSVATQLFARRESVVLRWLTLSRIPRQRAGRNAEFFLSAYHVTATGSAGAPLDEIVASL
jgi:hypothetical protein